MVPIGKPGNATRNNARKSSGIVAAETKDLCLVNQQSINRHRPPKKRIMKILEIITLARKNSIMKTVNDGKNNGEID